MGLGATIWPLVDQMNPDSSVKALSTTEVDVSSVEAGKTILVDVDELISFARRSGISIVCYYDDEGHPSFDASVDAA